MRTGNGQIQGRRAKGLQKINERLATGNEDLDTLAKRFFKRLNIFHRFNFTYDFLNILCSILSVFLFRFTEKKFIRVDTITRVL